MENAVVVARVIGPFMIVAGIGLLLNLKNYQTVIDNFMKHPALRYLGGMVALFMGLIILQFHNVWACNWALIITIMGWLSLIKGAVLIIFPGAFGKVCEAYHESTFLLMVHVGIVLAIGITLTAIGYLY